MDDHALPAVPVLDDQDAAARTARVGRNHTVHDRGAVLLDVNRICVASMGALLRHSARTITASRPAVAPDSIGGLAIPARRERSQRA